VSAFVVDASVAIKWLVAEAGATIAARLRHQELAAPDLLGPECANILRKKARLGEITAEEATVAAAALERLEVTLHATRLFLARATALALRLDHPAYDCCYLALAIALGSPLVTADRRLQARLARPDAGDLRPHLLPLDAVPER
jgi:predicted nucleic acid-binding protein